MQKQLQTNFFVFPKGKQKIINVDAPTIRDNIENGKREPMVRVRFSDNPTNYKVFKSVEILGPSRLAPNFKDPIPGTNGRGICYVTTNARIIGYY